MPSSRPLALPLAALALSCASPSPPASTAAAPSATAAPPAATAPSPPSAAPASSAAAPRASAAAPPAEAPLSARFADLPAELPDAPCHQVMVAVTSGEATAFGDKLAAGDVLVTFHPERTRLEGRGVVVIADLREPPDRCMVKSRPAPTHTVVRGQAAPPLTWAAGAMQAHLDVPTSLSPHVYLGRLEGTAPVAEHAHDGSWEILCAVDAAGTFTLGGVERRLGKREIVMVPAGTRHSWKPDPGSRLVGVQLYVPPGPEQRFKALAAGK